MASSTTRARSADGTELLVRRWPATTEPWAHVLLVHGLAEHSGRYEQVGQQLAAAGLDVTAYDQRGYGDSDGRRAFVDSWPIVHDDLAEQLAAVRTHAGGLPVVLYGHSLGGLIALGYVLGDRPGPDVLVLTSPAIDSAVPAWKQVLARVLGRVAPTIQIKNAFDGDDLSRDPAVGVEYLADPLNVHVTTARYAAAALAESARVRAGLRGLSLPTLVIHGTEDRIIPSDSSAALAEVPGVTRRTYPDHRHELHNEPDGPAILEDVIAWLRSELQP